MSSTQGEALDTLIETLENVRATQYVTAIGLIVLLYDHALTFQDEVELVWKTKLTIAQVTFLILRYLPILGILVENVQLSGLVVAVHFPDAFCRTWTGITTYLAAITMATSDFLVLLRLWVIWDRDRRLIALSLVGYVMTQLANIACVTYSVVSMTAAIVYSDDMHMCVFTQNISIATLWIPGLAFDVLIFTATVWNALLRPMPANSSMVKALYRDGFMYFMALSSMRVGNLVLALRAPLSLKFVASFFVWCASTVTTSRFFFSIRRTAAKDEALRGGIAPEPRASLGSTEVGSINMRIMRQSVSRKWSYS
ncbi:hypothetical protein BD626DRAFT_483072 [Schizophyllum amplum]|uniref:DUF6533 domain-containing protein n=1 Tax=Schizophyllum amplum TaxID=97359 RepID=A0A550CP24_9AGAR|nr:hypothetical protein BD626DRAFT_483072 [Auriculariopsis ampla]